MIAWALPFLSVANSERSKAFSLFKPEEGARFQLGSNYITAGSDWHFVQQQSNAKSTKDSDLDIFFILTTLSKG